MTHGTKARRSTTILALASVLSLTPVASARAYESAGGPRVAPPPTRICPIDWRSGTRAVKRLIRCAAEHHGLSPATALSIAYRESRYQPRAYNSRSCAKGIYQHLCRYWTVRASAFGFTDRSPFDARANIFVTMRMVERYGWAPWEG